jgi:hypothetical protein
MGGKRIFQMLSLHRTRILPLGRSRSAHVTEAVEGAARAVFCAPNLPYAADFVETTRRTTFLKNLRVETQKNGSNLHELPLFEGTPSI